MKQTLLSAITALSLTTAQAAPLVIANFDDLPIGTTWTLWCRYGGHSSTATIEADPQNPQNHVLHIRLKDWNTFPEFVVPEQYAGMAICQRFDKVRFRLFRSNLETDDYKQLHIFYGEDAVYQDNSYPQQGNRNEWQQREYALNNITESNTSNLLRLGLHHDHSDYYLDDVTLAGGIDDFETIEGGVLDICRKNTSSDYANYTRPIYIPEGQTLDLYTSRYTSFNAPLAGEGTLVIHSGGERTFLGDGKKYYPDWSRYTGDVEVQAHKAVESNAGFYGIIMLNNGKTFSPENVDDCLSGGQVCRMMGQSRVTVRTGAAIAFEKNQVAAEFAQLDTEAGSRLYGYYKATAGTGGYYIVGGNHADATLAGRIAPAESGGKPLSTALVGIIKEGRGTYRITANDNCISGGLRVRQGRVCINNNVSEAQAKRLTGGTGSTADGKAVAYVFGQGILSGTGNVAGTVDAYGTLEPGDGNYGTLHLRDYSAAAAKAQLRLHPTATLRLKVLNATEHDLLDVADELTYDNRLEDFTTSAEMPRVRVVLANGYDLHVGDELTLLTAKARLDADAWQLRMVWPSHLTWRAEERQTEDGRYALVAIVTSLDDDPDNAQNDDDDTTGDEAIDSDNTTTYTNDGDTHTLRHYADLQGIRLGIATPGSIAFENPSDVKTRLVMDHFNMLVPENELKFDATEPQQNHFEYGNAERMVSFAERNNMYMRGHTLAWHQQVAGWVSADGKKNDKNWNKEQLMAILKNHIMNVVGHFKGRIKEWDVVNECLDDDQSIVRNNPEAYKLRQQSVWNTVCGEAYIDSAFVWAHRADPEARLILNDYDNEAMGSAKAQAFYNLAYRLKRQGIPIDGVGMQCHLDAGKVDSLALARNIARYAEIGLPVIITELDLGINSRTEANLQQQARDYHRLATIAMTQPNCHALLIWGLSDDMSWRSSSPLLWDASLQPKPAFYAIRHALRATTADIDEAEAEAIVPVAIGYYDLQGHRLSAPHGLCIVRYSDGTSRKHFNF